MILPNPQLAVSLASQIKQKQIAAGVYLLERYSDFTQVQLFKTSSLAKSAMEKLKNTDSRPNGHVSAFIYSLSKHIGNSSVSQIEELIAQFLSKFTELPISSNICLEASQVENTLSVFGNELTDKIISGASRSELVGMSNKVSLALGILQKNCPDLYSETCAMVSNIVPFNSEVLNAGSSWNTFGSIFLRVLNEKETWTAAYEHIVHESAHHFIFCLSTIDPIVLNPEKLIHSPFRGVDRPILAVFHALFVLFRIQYAIGKLSEADIFFESTASYMYDRKNSMRIDSLICTKNLSESRNLTILGEKIVGDIDKWIRSSKPLTI